MKILTTSVALMCFMATMIATSNAAIPKTTKVSSNDSTSGYLNGKLLAGTSIQFTEGNDGADETLTIKAVARTAASDPQHVTAGSRPSGVIAEVVYYSGKLYFCTNSSTPTWEKLTST
jgi:hypothetical protein